MVGKQDALSAQTYQNAKETSRANALAEGRPPPDRKRRQRISRPVGPLYAGRFVADVPQLRETWDHEANDGLDPTTVPLGSNKPRQWRCLAHADDPEHPHVHRWPRSPADRLSSESGCPYCMNRKLCELNNLAAVHPDIAAEWDDVLNPEPGPEARFPGSPKKVMWKCLSGRDHPSYPQRIGTRTRFRLGCPIEAKEKKEQDHLARRAERERDRRDLAALYRQALEAAGKRDPFEDADVAWREANIGALVTREALDRRSTPPSRDASSTRASGQS